MTRLLTLLLLLGCAPLVGCAHGKGAAVAVDPRPSVRGVRIVGAKAFPATQIKDVLAQRATSWLHFTGLFSVAYPRVRLDGLTWEQDRIRIANFYALRGYFDARVVGSDLRAPPRTRVLPTGDPEWVRITHTVEEGQPSVIRDVRVEVIGGRSDEPHALEEWLDDAQVALARSVVATTSLEPGKRFTQDGVKDAAVDLRRRLGDQAFARAEVQFTVDAWPEDHAVDVRFRVWPGRQAVFGAHSVEGLDKVRPAYIERQIRFKEGGLWSHGKVSSTQRGIYGMRLFSMATVEPDRSGALPLDEDGREIVPVRIQLRESKPGLFKLSPGIGFDRQSLDVHARLHLSHANVFRRRLATRLDLMGGFKYLGKSDYFPIVDLDTEISWPDFPVRTLRAFGRFQMLLDVERGYKIWSPSLDVGLVWSPLGALKLTASYNLSYVDLFPDAAVDDLNVRIANLGGNTTFEDGFFLSRLRQDVTLDLRDAPLAPGKGLFARLTADEAGGPLQGRFRYLKLTGDLRGYVPLGTPRIVLALHGWTSWVHTWGDQPDIPVTEAVFAGGDGSVRGWKTRYLSPRTQRLPCTQRDCVVPLGGRFGVAGQAELRGNVVGGLWLAGFADAGRAWSESSAIVGAKGFFDDLQLSLGGGIRYDTPIGRIRLDVGVHPLAWTDDAFKQPYSRLVEVDRRNPNLLGNRGVYRTWTPAYPVGWNFHFGIGESF